MLFVYVLYYVSMPDIEHEKKDKCLLTVFLCLLSSFCVELCRFTFCPTVFE